MPSRNLNIIILAFCVSAACYVQHRRIEAAFYVGDALNLIHQHYVDPVDDVDLLNAALDGMTSKLDAHSQYIPAQEFETFQNNIDQEFAGIGIFVEQPPEGPPVRVITPLVGSPAQSAGILPGDQFIRIGDEDVSTMGLQDVSERLKGPVGTVVHVTVRRADKAGQQEVNLNIQRATIELESVIGDYRDQNSQWVYRLGDDPTIAYVRLTGFGEKTVEELRQVLIELNNNFSAMVLDLRGNGGGLLDTAIEVSDMFLDNGEIVSTRARGGIMEDQFTATPGTLVATNKPLAVLIDGDSASASEILAACLKDNQRAVIAGTRSYGKGTVQNVLPLKYGRSALRLTVARFYRPNGENLHRGKTATEDQVWGVKPNPELTVELDDESRKKLEMRWRTASYPSLATEDAEPPESNQSSLSIDPQLQRAVEYLRMQIPTEQRERVAA